MIEGTLVTPTNKDLVIAWKYKVFLGEGINHLATSNSSLNTGVNYVNNASKIRVKFDES